MHVIKLMNGLDKLRHFDLEFITFPMHHLILGRLVRLLWIKMDVPITLIKMVVPLACTLRISY